MPKTAVIIGAGPAGLTAAYELLQKTEYHPVILEESGEIGGISRTIEYKGNRMDIGGHRFFSKNDEIMKLWTDLLPEQGAPAEDDALLGREVRLSAGGPDPEKDDRVMLVRHRVSRIYYRRKFFDYPVSPKPATFRNMGLRDTARVAAGYLRSSVCKREEKSLRDFMINRFGEPLYRMFFEGYTEKVWGRNPSEISAAWGEQRIRGLSLRKMLVSFIKKPFQRDGSVGQKNVETSLIERYLYPKKGPGQLWETLAQKVVAMGGEIRLHHRVVSVKTENGRVISVTAETPDGCATVPGDVFLSSMPVKDLIAAMGDTAPEKVREIAENLPYRDFITAGVLVKRLTIENKTKLKTVAGLVPDCWIYIQENDVKLGRLQIFNNWSPYMVGEWRDTVWLGLEYFCREGDELWSKTDNDFGEFAVGELCKLGIVRREDVLDCTVQRVKKAYPAYFGSYAQMDHVVKYLNSLTNLYCVGRNGQHRYNNMDHSMLTSIAAVDDIASGGVNRSSVWNVNVEREYHEAK